MANFFIPPYPCYVNLLVVGTAKEGARHRTVAGGERSSAALGRYLFTAV